MSAGELCLAGIGAGVCAGLGSAGSGAGFAVSPVFGDLGSGVVDGDGAVGGATIAGAGTSVRGGSKTPQVNPLQPCQCGSWSFSDGGITKLGCRRHEATPFTMAL